MVADEIRQFIERYEHLEAEKRGLSAAQNEMMSDAKGRGFDTKALRRVIQLRKMRPDERAEFDAVVEMYTAALGM